eukprot:9847328-Heterocapsa_arctica.AAC.1
MNRDFASGEYYFWSSNEWRQWHDRRLAERVVASSVRRRAWLEEVRDGLSPDNQAWAENADASE